MRRLLTASFLLLTGVLLAQPAKVYRTDANASAPSPLFEYDVATDVWSTRANLPSSNTTGLASDGQTLYCLPEDGNIYSFDTVGNSWNLLMPGPTAAIGRNNVSMFEVLEGEFFWGRDGTSTLHYTVGGVWNQIATPRQLSSASSVDLTGLLVYVRTYSERGCFAFDPATLTFPVDCVEATSVGENSRAGEFLNGNFYSRDWSGAFVEIDVTTCIGTDTMTPLTTEHSSTAVGNGLIYINGYSGSLNTLEVFDPVARTVTPLASTPPGGVPGGHPAMTYVGNSAGPAVISANTVTVPATVSQGDLGVMVSLTIDNTGADSASSLAAALSFTGTVDRGSEYTVTPDPANPTTIGAGGSETLLFTVDVSPLATLEIITIDAMVVAIDDFSGMPVNDPNATVPGMWDVLYSCSAPFCGDCNGDMQITILDALTAARHSAGLIVLTGIDFTNCNVTGLLEPDPMAEVTILDALSLAQVAAGLPTLLMCC